VSSTTSVPPRWKPCESQQICLAAKDAHPFGVRMNGNHHMIVTGHDYTFIKDHTVTVHILVQNEDIDALATFGQFDIWGVVVAYGPSHDISQCVWTVGGRRFITAGERGNTRAAWRFPTACNSNLAKIQQICFAAKEPPPPHGWSHSTRSHRGETSLGSSTGASSPPSPTRCPNVRQMRKHSRLSFFPRQIALCSSRLYIAVLSPSYRTRRYFA